MAKGQKTGGRTIGTPNKVTADIKALAQSHGPAAIMTLARLAGFVKGSGGSDSDLARISAIKELLDRGYGKPGQTVDLRHHLATAVATDADLIAIAVAGRGGVAAPEIDTDEPGGMVH